MPISNRTFTMPVRARPGGLLGSLGLDVPPPQPSLDQQAFTMPTGWRVDVYDEHHIVLNKVVGTTATQEQAKQNAIGSTKRAIKSLVEQINQNMNYIASNKRILAKLEALELTEPELPLTDPDGETDTASDASEPELATETLDREQDMVNWLSRQERRHISNMQETIRQSGSSGTMTIPPNPVTTDNIW